MITLGEDADASPIAASRSTACATATWSTKLFNELGPRYKARPGGYLRILKFGFRVGRQGADGAGRAGGSARTADDAAKAEKRGLIGRPTRAAPPRAAEPRKAGPIARLFLAGIH